MIKKTCKTCKHIGTGCEGTSAPCLSWRESRASLWVEIARLREQLKSERKRRRRNSTRVRSK